MGNQITAEMTIAEIFSKYPHQSQRLAQVITNAGLHCSNCSAATWETLEAGVLGHGMSQKNLEKLLKELNAVLEEKIDHNTITLTPRAAKKFREFVEQEEEHQKVKGLRFGDSAGGCGGFEYILEFSEGAESDDEIFTSEEIEIHVKKGMLGRLRGCVIDYIDGLHNPGFKVSNPNVKSTCGCGHSQGY